MITAWNEEGLEVEIDGETSMVMNTDWMVGEPMMLAQINGKEITVQVCVCVRENMCVYVCVCVCA